jgi:hypothetical protein
MKSRQVINDDICLPFYLLLIYLFYGGETGSHIFQISYSDILVSTWMERGRENLICIFVLQAEIYKNFFQGGVGTSKFLTPSYGKLSPCLQTCAGDRRPVSQGSLCPTKGLKHLLWQKRNSNCTAKGADNPPPFSSLGWASGIAKPYEIYVQQRSCADVNFPSPPISESAALDPQ